MRWLLLLLISCRGGPSPDAVPVVNATVYHNANILTLNDSRPTATVLRVEDGRITHVANSLDESLTGPRVDLKGATVLPGLVDGHFHLRNLGAKHRQIDLTGTVSLDEVVARVREGVTRFSDEWIYGRGWDQNDWPEQVFPTAANLDLAERDRPVWLTRIDGHAAWLNSEALRRAGITSQTPDVPGGEILRDKVGNPTGVLIDNAMDVAKDRMPQPTVSEIRSDLLAAMEHCAQLGLTGVHDMGTSLEVLKILEELENSGQLTLRYTAYLYGEMAHLLPRLEQPPDREGSLQVVGVKLFADGALGSRGAALLRPYADRSDSKGLLLIKPFLLKQHTKLIHDRGYQAAIHAIGDRGVRVALDAIEHARGTMGHGRHRIEHVQVVSPEDMSRFGQVVASVQPTHATSDMPWAEARLGANRIKGAYAWRKLVDAGANLVLGSDAPIESPNPWWGVYAAVTRQDLQGAPSEGWYADQRLTRQEALRGFTHAPAHAAGQTDRGVIRVGAAADLTIVDQDPFRVEAAELPKIRTLRTVVGGVEVFVAP